MDSHSKRIVHPKPSKQEELEDVWRHRVDEAHRFYEIAKAETRKAAPERCSGDGPVAFSEAQKVENLAFKEYQRVLNIFNGLVLSGRVPEPDVIMIVDDEELVRRFAVTALERDDKSVLVAASGEEGLAILRDFAGRVDLVLADLHMKAGMNGLRFRDRLQEEFPETLVAIMSGDSYGGGIPDGIERVQKPFTKAQLCEHVHRLLKRN